MMSAVFSADRPRAGGTVASDEINHFDRIAAAWWDPEGAFKPLHRLNPVRVDYIRAAAVGHFGLAADAESPLAGLTVLDLGCGGGLVSEAMARLGASVTGIDASDETIRIAQRHAEQQGLAVRYRCAAPEELADAGERYDLVLALEIIEHVRDLGAFVLAVAALKQPGGAVALSTINRTLKSLALAKIGAEYVLRWLPAGTHDWRKFVRPSELAAALRRQRLQLVDVAGLIYDPVTGQWSLGRPLDVNYIGLAT